MPGVLSVLHAAVLGLVLLPVLAVGVAAQTPATLSISADHDDVDEGNSGNQVVTYTVALSRQVSADFAWKICFTGTAEYANDASKDYRIELNGSPNTTTNCTTNLALGPSATGLSHAFNTVRVYGDTDVEPDETIIATLEIITDPVPSDVTLGTSVHTLTINNDDNSIPTVANAIPNQTATVGTAFSYAFPENTFNDADSGDTLTYTATKGDGTALPSWLTFTALTRTFSGTPAAGDAGKVSIKVTAEDTNGGTVSDTFDITVAKPVVSIARGTSPVTEGTGATFTVHRTGATTSALTVLLSVGENTAGGRDYVATGNEGNKQVTIAANASSATYTVPTQGDNVDEPNGEVTVSIRASSTYAIHATDGEAEVAVSDDDDPPVDPGTPNSAPTVANAIPDRTATVGTPFSFAFPLNTFNDADNDPLTYTTGSLPSWLTFAPSSRTFSGTPTVAGTTTVRVTANDDRGGTVSDVFRITVRPSNADERDSPSSPVREGLVLLGRTLGLQSVAIINDRLTSPRLPGATGHVAGQTLTGNAIDVQPATDVETGSVTGEATPIPASALETGTSFELNGETGRGSRMSLWGRGTLSSFRNGTVIDGRATTLSFGTDRRHGDTTLGVMVARSRGDIRYRDDGDGEPRTRRMTTELTAVIPYGGMDVGDDLSMLSIAI